MIGTVNYRLGELRVRNDETNLGAIIKAARLSKGLTQEVLSEKVGIGLRHFMGIENEGSYPSYKVLYKIIRELNISADTIFYPERMSGNGNNEDLNHMLKACDERSLLIIRATIRAALDSQLEV